MLQTSETQDKENSRSMQEKEVLITILDLMRRGNQNAYYSTPMYHGWLYAAAIVFFPIIGPAIGVQGSETRSIIIPFKKREAQLALIGNKLAEIKCDDDGGQVCANANSITENGFNNVKLMIFNYFVSLFEVSPKPYFIRYLGGFCYFINLLVDKWRNQHTTLRNLTKRHRKKYQEIQQHSESFHKHVVKFESLVDKFVGMNDQAIEYSEYNDDFYRHNIVKTVEKIEVFCENFNILDFSLELKRDFFYRDDCRYIAAAFSLNLFIELRKIIIGLRQTIENKISSRKCFVEQNATYSSDCVQWLQLFKQRANKVISCRVFNKEPSGKQFLNFIMDIYSVWNCIVSHVYSSHDLHKSDFNILRFKKLSMYIMIIFDHLNKVALEEWKQLNGDVGRMSVFLTSAGGMDEMIKENLSVCRHLQKNIHIFNKQIRYAEQHVPVRIVDKYKKMNSQSSQNPVMLFAQKNETRRNGSSQDLTLSNPKNFFD